ncbi:uncharacterized protein LOC114533321 [Dendronephthya gigantea]|uniref:uncharacterized protein LOC114533321 n=1 Tax=Dendronephthya gigantea TaxID=151771 RepID=UPI00106AA634|nr:uncharacterized protein LOC114533321 [Dendronephthya gigantea]
MNNFISSLVLYTLLMNLSNSQGQENTTTICYNSTLEGFRLNTTVWQTKGVLEKIDCILECATKPCCRSINYKKTEDKSNCEMLHYVVSEKPKKLVENTSYDHVHLVNPEKDFNTMCESGEGI